MLNSVSRRPAALSVVRSILLSSIVLSAAFLVGWTSPVSACSCAAIDADTVGALILAAPAAAEVSILSNRDGVWVAQVLHDNKGNLPDQVAILAPDHDGANCGVVWREGTHIGLLFGLDEDRGWLTANSCGQVDPELLTSWNLPEGESAASITLTEPPKFGGWSGWLLALAAAAGILYVAKNVRDPAWRNAWFRPNNARNSPVRRPDDPTERGRFGR